MRLIYSQVQFIETEIKRLQKELESYQAYISGRRFGDGDNHAAINIGDKITEDQQNEKFTKLMEYKNILQSSVCITAAPTELIGIGSRFKLKFDDSDEIEEYTLVETIIGNHIVDLVITVGSVLGQSVLGKRKNEKFSYHIGGKDTNPMVTGTIVKIEKNFESMNPFIRGKDKSHRRSKNVSYLNKKVITHSQIKLIQEEIEQLGKQKITDLRDKICINRRLSELRKMLCEAEIASLPEEEVIGIGTTFSMMLFTSNKTVFQRVEMVDIAVSSETKEKYVERISPLGNAIFGLRNNEEFLVSLGNGNYASGIVYDISNHLNDIKTNDPSIYQKLKGSKSVK